MTDFYTNVYQRGNKIYVRGVKDGVPYIKSNEYKPTLYQTSKNTQSQFKGISGENLEAVHPGNIKECKNYIERYKDVSNFKIYGNDNWSFQYIRDKFPNDVKFDPSMIRIFNLDIEVQSGLNITEDNQFIHSDEGGFPHADQAEWPVTLIGLYDSLINRYKIFGYGNGKDNYSKQKHFENIKNDGGQHDLTPDDIDYINCESEQDLLFQFVNYWSMNYPDIYTGWNIDGFDTPYLINRIDKICGHSTTKRLSPFGILTSYTKEDKYKNEVTVHNIAGIAQIDYMTLYKKFTYTDQESYKLDHIAMVELGDGKLSYEESGTLKRLFRENFQKYTEYNAVDILCVQRLDDKMKFLELIMTIAYYAKVNFEDVFSPVKTWDSIIYNYLLDMDICIPPKQKNEKPRKFAGAFVKEPQLGRKKWIVSVDLASLYPHLIMQYNIGVETHVPFDKLPHDLQEWRKNLFMYDFDALGDPIVDGPNGRNEWLRRLLDKEVDLSLAKKYDLVFAANGEFFHKNKKSFFNELMDLFYNRRKIEKKKMLRYEQELVWMKSLLENGSTPSQDDIDNNRSVDGLEESFLFSTSTDSVQIARTKNEIARLDGLQMALKILLNSAYGSIGNAGFRYFDLRVAEAITMSGQANIMYIAKQISLEINRIAGCDPNIDRIVAIDTDSVTGDTIINVDGQKMSIESFYDNTSDNFMKNDPISRDYVKKVEGKRALAFSESGNVPTFGDIKYVMKHRVNKRMFKITCGDRSVTVTEDHSIIVERDGKIKSIKPMERLQGDKLICLDGHTHETTTNWEIEDLGVQEIDVYDIEVEDHHNFFANDILVHNSNYIDASPLVELYQQKYNDKYKKEPSTDDITNWLDNIFSKNLEPFIDGKYREFAEYQNSLEHKMFMDREVIAESALWTAKKRYIMKILDSEGVRFAEPKYKVMGQEAIKSSTPQVCADKLKEAYKIILDGDEQSMQRFIADFKKEHAEMEPHIVASNKSINGLKKYRDDNTIFKKGSPGHVRGALMYNNLVESDKKYSDVELVMEGEKVKILSLKEPNPLHAKAITFPRFLDEGLGLNKYIDRNTMFDKTFIKPLEPMLKLMEWKPKKVASLF